jgi:tryptophan 2,3-dioxygenase
MNTGSGRVLNPSQPNPRLRYEWDRGSDYELDTRLPAALAALVPEEELLHPDHRLFQIAHLITPCATSKTR